MLITKTFYDVPSGLNPRARPIRVFVIAPNVPNYPQAKFPGTCLLQVLQFEVELG